MNFSFDISARDVALGGGFDLTFFCDGVEVGAGVFPCDAFILDARERDLLAYQEALAVAEDWINSRLVS